MTLRADLQNIADRAEKLQSKRSARPGSTGRAIYKDLHQILVGPPASGKTHTAIEYAKELAAKGRVRNDKPHMQLEAALLHNLPLNNMRGMMPNPLVDDIANNDRGVFILDELKAGHEYAIQLALSLIDENKGVVIITGRENDVTELLERHPELAGRLPPPITIADEPTPEQTAEQKRTATAREWNEMKVLDITLGKNVKSPARARFSRSKTPVN